MGKENTWNGAGVELVSAVLPVNESIFYYFLVDDHSIVLVLDDGGIKRVVAGVETGSNRQHVNYSTKQKERNRGMTHILLGIYFSSVFVVYVL